ncbi:MAG: type II toxin-antitoxin system MqsA family antitoxin [Anaerolineae bacterium]
MRREKDICPICGGQMLEKKIMYSDWIDEHLLVIKNVPVRECQSCGKRFFSAKVAKEIEHLFEMARRQELEATEKMEVPVVSLHRV